MDGSFIDTFSDVPLPSDTRHIQFGVDGNIHVLANASLIQKFDGTTGDLLATIDFARSRMPFFTNGAFNDLICRPRAGRDFASGSRIVARFDPFPPRPAGVVAFSAVNAPQENRRLCAIRECRHRMGKFASSSAAAQLTAQGAASILSPTPGAPMPASDIVIQGAREHNLRNVDLCCRATS